jgi:hypothetical protein
MALSAECTSWSMAATSTSAELRGNLTSAEVGTAVMVIARRNDVDPEDDGRPTRPADWRDWHDVLDGRGQNLSATIPARWPNAVATRSG